MPIFEVQNLPSNQYFGSVNSKKTKSNISSPKPEEQRNRTEEAIHSTVAHSINVILHRGSGKI